MGFPFNKKRLDVLAATGGKKKQVSQVSKMKMDKPKLSAFAKAFNKK